MEPVARFREATAAAKAAVSGESATLAAPPDVVGLSAAPGVAVPPTSSG
jgi:hypothetical protein